MCSQKLSVPHETTWVFQNFIGGLANDILASAKCWKNIRSVLRCIDAISVFKAYMQFGKLVLVISNEFVSQFAELNVVIFSNLTSIRRTDPSTELFKNKNIT